MITVRLPLADCLKHFTCTCNSYGSANGEAVSLPWGGEWAQRREGALVGRAGLGLEPGQSDSWAHPHNPTLRTEALALQVWAPGLGGTAGLSRGASGLPIMDLISEVTTSITVPPSPPGRLLGWYGYSSPDSSPNYIATVYQRWWPQPHTHLRGHVVLHEASIPRGLVTCEHLHACTQPLRTCSSSHPPSIPAVSPALPSVIGNLSASPTLSWRRLARWPELGWVLCREPGPRVHPLRRPIHILRWVRYTLAPSA